MRLQQSPWPSGCASGNCHKRAAAPGSCRTRISPTPNMDGRGFLSWVCLSVGPVDLILRDCLFRPSKRRVSYYCRRDISAVVSALSLTTPVVSCELHVCIVHVSFHASLAAVILFYFICAGRVTRYSCHIRYIRKMFSVLNPLSALNQILRSLRSLR